MNHQHNFKVTWDEYPVMAGTSLEVLDAVTSRVVGSNSYILDKQAGETWVGRLAENGWRARPNVTLKFEEASVRVPSNLNRISRLVLVETVQLHLGPRINFLVGWSSVCGLRADSARHLSNPDTGWLPAAGRWPLRVTKIPDDIVDRLEPIIDGRSNASFFGPGRARIQAKSGFSVQLPCSRAPGALPLVLGVHRAARSRRRRSRANVGGEVG